MNRPYPQSIDLAGKLAIVIPVHNRSGFTRNCLEHLRNQTVRTFQTIVVDDGSVDGTAEMIQGDFPEVVLLHGNGSLWWTGATNLGVKVALGAGAAYILTLNDDTLPGPEFIENMMAAAARNPGALIGAFAVDAGTGRPVFGGDRMDWLTASAKDLLTDPTNPRMGLVEVTHYPGRGLLIPQEVFRRIGLFDSKYFPHYGADYDFTLRARRHAFPIFCNYSAVLGIYPEASGDAQNRKQKSAQNYYRHLFHIKGAANLKVFFWLAVRNCPKPLLPMCLPAGIARRIFGYLLDWVKEIYVNREKRDASYRSA